LVLLNPDADGRRARDGRGPYPEEGGWEIYVPSNGGASVLCIVAGRYGDGSLFEFELLVTEIGGATEDVGHAIEHILRNASQITQLRVG
jgi:hypothetical protein